MRLALGLLLSGSRSPSSFRARSLLSAYEDQRDARATLECAEQHYQAQRAKLAAKEQRAVRYRADPAVDLSTLAEITEKEERETPEKLSQGATVHVV